MPGYVKGFAEMVLIVSDVKKSARFYGKIVGLTPEREASKEWAWFFLGDHEKPQRLGLHRGKLLFEEKSPLPEGQRWGRVHFALHVDFNNLEMAAEQVRSNGIEVYGPETFDWMNARSYYFYDPDGNLIEFWAELN